MRSDWNYSIWLASRTINLYFYYINKLKFYQNQPKYRRCKIGHFFANEKVQVNIKIFVESKNVDTILKHYA